MAGAPPAPLADASVRRARANDAPAVGLVQATVFREAYAGRLPDEVVALFEPDAFARSWRESLAAPPEGVHRLLVACAGDQVVGLAAVGPSQDPDAGPAWGEVTVLGVHPDARRQGHGSRLLNATVDVLREAGAEAVTLWLLSDDEAARGFLGASGFAPDGAFRDRVAPPTAPRCARSASRPTSASTTWSPTRLRELLVTHPTTHDDDRAMTAAALPDERRREVVRQSWSVGVATGAYGISFGALAVAAGLDVWQAQVLSLVMFTGGSQFAFVGIIGAGGLAAAPAAVATAAMLGIRNGLYGLQTSQFLRVTGLRRLGAAQLTIDESTAVGRPSRTAGTATRVLAHRDRRLLTLEPLDPGRVRPRQRPG